MKNYFECELRQILQKRCKKSTQLQVSIELKVSPSYLCDVLAARRDISPALATALGFTKTTVFTRKP